MANTHSILIIDDDSFLLDMYALKFSQSGFEVDSALGSELAWEKIQKGAAPDVMLVDIVMPGMTGFELLEKITEKKLMPNTLKIVLSNRGQQNDIDQAKKYDVAGYIVKANNTPGEVISKVNDILKEHSK
jgi:two-component system chemotaxis response regulator CheY